LNVYLYFAEYKIENTIYKRTRKEKKERRKENKENL